MREPIVTYAHGGDGWGSYSVRTTSGTVTSSLGGALMYLHDALHISHREAEQMCDAARRKTLDAAGRIVPETAK